MFWGLNLKPNRKYSQTTSKNFHISQAALSEGQTSQVFVTSENQKFLICTLDGSCRQVSLDLNFAEGEEVSFQTVGPGSVTLSGYVIEDPYDEEEEESDYTADELYKQLKKQTKKASAEKAENDEAEDNDEDEDDEEVELGELEDGDSELGEEEEDADSDVEEDEEDDDDEEDEEDDSDAEDEIQQPKAKQPKLEKPHSKQNGVAKPQTAAASEAGDKKSKKEKKAAAKKENQKQPQQQQDKAAPKPQQPKQQAGGERTLQGGVKIEELRVGNGPEAKTGKRAIVYYEGRLKSNNKVFDSNTKGSGFKFGLGRGEVIRGWDVGVAGMKVGGKRRITCPAGMAYGKNGMPPVIPPNSTLVFEVELKGVQ